MKHKNNKHPTVLVETGSEHLSNWLGTLRGSNMRILGPAQLCVLRRFKTLTDGMMKVSLSPQELKESLEGELSSVRGQIAAADAKAYGRRLSPDEFSKRARHLKALQKQLTAFSVQEALEKLENLDSKQLGRENHLKNLVMREKLDFYLPEFSRLQLTERREELKQALERLKQNGNLHLPDMVKKFNKNHWKNPISLFVRVYENEKDVYVYSCSIPKEADIGKKLFDVLPGIGLQFIKEEKHKAIPLKGLPALIIYSSEYQLRALAPRIAEAVCRFFGIPNPSPPSGKS